MNQRLKSNALVRACLADGVPREANAIGVECRLAGATIRNVIRDWRKAQSAFPAEDRIRIYDAVYEKRSGKFILRYQLSAEPDADLGLDKKASSPDLYKADQVKKIDTRLKKWLKALEPWEENVFRTSIVQLPGFQP